MEHAVVTQRACGLCACGFTRMRPDAVLSNAGNHVFRTVANHGFHIRMIILPGENRLRIRPRRMASGVVRCGHGGCGGAGGFNAHVVRPLLRGPAFMACSAACGRVPRRCYRMVATADCGLCGGTATTMRQRGAMGGNLFLHAHHRFLEGFLLLLNLRHLVFERFQRGCFIFCCVGRAGKLHAEQPCRQNSANTKPCPRLARCWRRQKRKGGHFFKYYPRNRFIYCLKPFCRALRKDYFFKK